MILSWKAYSILAVITITSFAATWLLPTPDQFKGILSLPGFGSLVYALFQLFRDQTEHEKRLELQSKEQIFNLSVSSHMSNVAFDKHVAFCEEYISTIYDGLKNLFMTGPSKEAITLSADLQNIRLKFRPWLTSEILEKIVKFEKALT